MAERSIAEYAKEIAERLERVDPNSARLSYDSISDTLYVDLEPQPRPGVSVYLQDGWMVRVDRDTDTAIGLQIENVLARAAHKYPVLAKVVLLTEPVGYEPSPIEQFMRRDVAEHWSETADELRGTIPELALVGD
jgi:hypothetical protein